MSGFYKEIIQSKNNLPIPVFSSGKAMHSKYDPLREADSFGMEKTDGLFTIILGLGAGYHVSSYAKRNPHKTILVIENSKADFHYLSEKCSNIKELSENRKITFAFSEEKETIVNGIVKNYIPAFHGNISILSNRMWISEKGDAVKEINEAIKEAINLSSQDFSVQSHFGLIWQKNIFSNLKLYEKTCSEKKELQEEDLTKTAAIIAAGPSLDKTIFRIIENRKKYFVIATDTGNRILEKYEITPDAVVSIDAQNVSVNHFISKAEKNTSFILDLCASSSAARRISENGNPLFFVNTGHPISSFAQFLYPKNFLHLESGSGTVTITAIDFAKKFGFKTIEVFGADFSYIENKPYAKGTYLEELYRKNENRIQTAEKSFSNLLYRTEIFRSENNVIRNQVMDSYKESLLAWFEKNHIQWNYEGKIYKCNCNSQKEIFSFSQENFSYRDFFTSLEKKINPSAFTGNPDESIFPLLPYIAYLRKKYKDRNLEIVDFVNLAHDKLLEYNY